MSLHFTVLYAMPYTSTQSLLPDFLVNVHLQYRLPKYARILIAGENIGNLTVDGHKTPNRRQRPMIRNTIPATYPSLGIILMTQTNVHVHVLCHID